MQVRSLSDVVVQLELLVPVAVPAIMPLSWYFVTHRFALSGAADRRLPEQRRNRPDLPGQRDHSPADPAPLAEPVTVQRVASNSGVIMVTGQKIALGRIHARQIVTVHVAADTITIDIGDDARTIRRATQPVRSIKAQQHRKAAHVS